MNNFLSSTWLVHFYTLNDITMYRETKKESHCIQWHFLQDHNVLFPWQEEKASSLLPSDEMCNVCNFSSNFWSHRLGQTPWRLRDVKNEETFTWVGRHTKQIEIFCFCFVSFLYQQRLHLLKTKHWITAFSFSFSLHACEHFTHYCHCFAKEWTH